MIGAQMDKTIFLIKPPPPEEPGRYALVIYRPMSMMGGQPVIVFIDRLHTVAGTHTGFRGKEVLVKFPVNMPYVMVDRRYTELMTPVEIALVHQMEEKAVRAILDPEGPPPPGVEEGLVEALAPVLHTGQYV